MNKPYHLRIDFDDGTLQSHCFVSSIFSETEINIMEDEHMAEVFPADSNAFDTVTKYLEPNPAATVVQIPFSL